MHIVGGAMPPHFCCRRGICPRCPPCSAAIVYIYIYNVHMYCMYGIFGKLLTLIVKEEK